jgi:hypothetical protein
VWNRSQKRTARPKTSFPHPFPDLRPGSNETAKSDTCRLIGRRQPWPPKCQCRPDREPPRLSHPGGVLSLRPMKIHARRADNSRIGACLTPTSAWERTAKRSGVTVGGTVTRKGIPTPLTSWGFLFLLTRDVVGPVRLDRQRVRGEVACRSDGPHPREAPIQLSPRHVALRCSMRSVLKVNLVSQSKFERVGRANANVTQKAGPPRVPIPGHGR